jgi:hypothetical protein
MDITTYVCQALPDTGGLKASYDASSLPFSTYTPHGLSNLPIQAITIQVQLSPIKAVRPPDLKKDFCAPLHVY